MTAIDAEARAVPHEHRWTDWTAPFEGYQWFQCRTCCCGAREYRKVIARPGTAIWHTNNDFDEQEKR